MKTARLGQLLTCFKVMRLLKKKSGFKRLKMRFEKKQSLEKVKIAFSIKLRKLIETEFLNIQHQEKLCGEILKYTGL